MDIEEIKKIVEIDPETAGEDFYMRLESSLTKALESGGLGPEEIERLKPVRFDQPMMTGHTVSDALGPQVKEMEEQLFLSDEYEIHSHRKGALGAINKFIKWIALKIRLRTDVGVRQQALYNTASFVSVQLLIAYIDLLNKKLNEQAGARDAEIEALKEEIARLKERLG